MTSQTYEYETESQENIRLPSRRLIERFPIAATIAALEAMISTTKKLIRAENPSRQELIEWIENGETIPSHFFIAHTMSDILDQLRISIHAYSQQINQRMAQIDLDDFPF